MIHHHISIHPSKWNDTSSGRKVKIQIVQRDVLKKINSQFKLIIDNLLEFFFHIFRLIWKHQQDEEKKKWILEIQKSERKFRGWVPSCRRCDDVKRAFKILFQSQKRCKFLMLMESLVILLNCPLLLEFRMYLDGHLIASNAFCRHQSFMYFSPSPGDVLWALFKWPTDQPNESEKRCDAIIHHPKKLYFCFLAWLFNFFFFLIGFLFGYVDKFSCSVVEKQLFGSTWLCGIN